MILLVDNNYGEWKTGDRIVFVEMGEMRFYTIKEVQGDKVICENGILPLGKMNFLRVLEQKDGETNTK